MVNRTALFLALSVALLAGARADAQVTSERMVRAAQEPQNWLTYSGGYVSQRYSLLRQIDRTNVKNLELKWILPNQVFGAWQSTPLVVDGIMYLTQRPNDVMAVDAKTGRVFWQYRHTVSPDARVCCGSNNRGLAILGDTLFLATLDARLIAVDARNGRPLWNVRRRRPEARLLDDDGAAGGEGQGAGRHRRRRVRHPRLHRGVRREDRQGSLALLHHSRSRRAGARDLEGRRLEDRRWIDLADAVVRPGAESHLLGRRQSRPGLESGSAARRQPVYRFGGRPRRRHRRVEVALPVHAQRRLRLRRGADRGARRSELARHADEDDAVGESQRDVLRARSRDGTLPARLAVRQGELEQRPRRQGPPDPDAAAGRPADVARQPGRDQLVLAVVQPAHRAVLRLDLGRLCVDLPQGAADLRAGPIVRRRRRAVR